jgi:hypothetical protein
MNYLSPHVRSGPWTEEEDALLVRKMNEIGPSWSSISEFFNGRSDNDIKNRWYAHLRYMTVRQGDALVMVHPAANRKTRRRRTTCPQQNALMALGQIAAPPRPEPIIEWDPFSEEVAFGAPWGWE